MTTLRAIPATSFRSTLGGLSLLVAIALVCQASAGVVDGAAPASGQRLDPQVRQVAITPVRHSHRATRRETIRPLLARPSAARSARQALSRPALPPVGPGPVRPPMLWHTDLPPPVAA